MSKKLSIEEIKDAYRAVCKAEELLTKDELKSAYFDTYDLLVHFTDGYMVGYILDNDVLIIGNNGEEYIQE